MKKYEYLREETRSTLRRVETAVERLGAGGMVLVVDDFDRENEADLLMAADFATPEAVAFMAAEGRGLICQTITAERATALQLPPQAESNTALHGTAFTVSVDAAHGVASGISASDRAHTMRLVAGSAVSPEELARPGHLFPIVAQPGGVFARRGHTEAGCDLTRLAGCSPSAVICEVMNRDGTMARGERVRELAREHDLPLVSVEDLVRYRSLTGDGIVEPVTSTTLPTRYGTFTTTVWESDDPGCAEIVTISSLHGPAGPAAAAGPAGEVNEEPTDAPIVRLHSECLTGESFGSHRCDCGPQLDAALEAIGREPGIVVYLRQEGRGIGLVEKLRAYSLQDEGLDTVDANLELGHRADERNYAAATAVLRRLGLERVRLLTNSPDKYEALLCSGIEAEYLTLDVGRRPANETYMETKALRMGHRLEIHELETSESYGRKR